MIKRYLITKKFRNALKNAKFSIGNLSKLAGFEVKNITSRNKTINELHLKKLKSLYNLPALQETNLNYSENLGKYAITQPIKQLRKEDKLAEIFGIILGDGNLCRNRIHISFDKRAKGYISYVRNLFREATGLYLRYNEINGTNQSYLYCYNQDLIKEFISLGLQRGDKITNQVSVPNWVKEKEIYSKRCLRGLIDTDGCIYFSKRDKQIYIKFTNFNKVLLDDFSQITKRLGYHFAHANKNNFCLYRKKEVARFIKDIKPFKAIGDMV